MFGGGNRDLYDDGSGYGGGGGGAGGAGVGPGGTGGAFNQGRSLLFQRHIFASTHNLKKYTFFSQATSAARPLPPAPGSCPAPEAPGWAAPA